MTRQMKNRLLTLIFIIFSPVIFSELRNCIYLCPVISGLNGSINEESVFDLNAAESDSIGSDRAEEISGNEDAGSSFKVTADGFIEIENYYSSDRKKTKSERNLKNEFRANIELKAGTENIFIYSKTNLYYLPQFKNEKAGENYYYRKDFNVADNLMISDRQYEIEPDELYVNFSNSLFRLRAGNQIYLWGTADLYNPTSYFNPSDYREYIFADEDELKLGVPSASLMLFPGFATVEMVFVPVHIPSEIPAEGNYWEFESESPLVEFHMQENRGTSKKFSNSAYGLRSSFSRRGVDFSLSYYHGPDRNPVFIPQYIDYTRSPYMLEIKPEYFVVNKFGFDLSTQISDFVVQCEAVYSPDKTWLVERDLKEFMLANLTRKSSFETEKSHYVHYAAGFNYYIPVNSFVKDYDGESIVTVEWQQAGYDNKNVMKPLISKILLLRFEEICFESRLKISISYLTEINKNAYVVKPEIKYDFQNGLSLKASYVYINAESDADSIMPDEDTSVIYFMRDRDMGTLSARYDF